MEIIRNQHRGKMYWGADPFPAGSEFVGLVFRDEYDQGALVRLSSGEYVQGNAGSFRMLDQRQVAKALLAERSSILQIRS